MGDVFTNRSTLPTPFGDSIFRCTFFTNLSTKPTTSGGQYFFTIHSSLFTLHSTYALRGLHLSLHGER